LIIATLKDENFADNQAAMKSMKIFTYTCLVYCNIAQIVLTEQLTLLTFELKGACLIHTQTKNSSYVHLGAMHVCSNILMQWSCRLKPLTDALGKKG